MGFKELIEGVVKKMNNMGNPSSAFQTPQSDLDKDTPPYVDPLLITTSKTVFQGKPVFPYPTGEEEVAHIIEAAHSFNILSESTEVPTKSPNKNKNTLIGSADQNQPTVKADETNGELYLTVLRHKKYEFVDGLGGAMPEVRELLINTPVDCFQFLYSREACRDMSAKFYKKQLKKQRKAEEERAASSAHSETGGLPSLSTKTGEYTPQQHAKLVEYLTKPYICTGCLDHEDHANHKEEPLDVVSVGIKTNSERRVNCYTPDEKYYVGLNPIDTQNHLLVPENIRSNIELGLFLDGFLTLLSTKGLPGEIKELQTLESLVRMFMEYVIGEEETHPYQSKRWFNRVKVFTVSGSFGSGKDFTTNHYLKPELKLRNLLYLYLYQSQLENEENTKQSLSEALTNNNEGVEPELLEDLDIPMTISLASHLKRDAIKYGYGYEEIHKVKNAQSRNFMQKLGTEFGREIYGRMVWIASLLSEMRYQYENNAVKTFVITDARFANEIMAFKLIFRHCFSIKIEAPKRSNEAINRECQGNIDLITKFKSHPSEVSLNNTHPSVFDMTFDNEKNDGKKNYVETLNKRLKAKESEIHCRLEMAKSLASSNSRNCTFLETSSQ